AFALQDFDSGPRLLELLVPEPGPGQVRVRVEAAGLNRVDVTIAAHGLRAYAEYAFPVVLGRDGAGQVDALGDGVEGLVPGDEVLGHVLFGETLHDGTVAEYALLPAEAVVCRPPTLAVTHAAALPLAGAAALAAVEGAALQDRERVLVAGASGGVGSLAVQLAADRGAVVVATGEPEDVERLKSLGATTVVDRREDVAEQVLGERGPVDALLDLVSVDPQTFEGYARAVRPGGRVASTTPGATADAIDAAGLTGGRVTAMPTRETLLRLLAEIQRGALRVDVGRTLMLADAARGLHALERGGVRGKIVVRIGH
ncbi:MAG TPA: NADP-dependent oxidoreductase, partial [Gaiellaceae bacterium]|nr:NADP-dependent oxidoreductase [Gaiellaceae bacterium]